MPARVIAHCGTDHTRWHTPLPQQTRNDRRIIKYEFTEFSYERAGIMLGQPVNDHNSHWCQHAEAYISRRDFFCIGHHNHRWLSSPECTLSGISKPTCKQGNRIIFLYLILQV